VEFFGVNPGRRIAFYFLAAIIFGAIILSLPVSCAGEPVRFINALFTATSAVCVTGLTVVDTGTDYSLFGQIVILVLIQLGGLGIMTFATALFAALGSKLSFGDRLGLSQSFLAEEKGKHTSLLKAVIVTTITVELIGAILLYFKFRPDYSTGRAIYHAVFHSVSAFCNAGFSTFSTSLEGYQNDVVMLLIFAGLIICGGLGFAVIAEIFDKFRNRQSKLSLHTKLCLSGTVIILILGTAAILVAEYQNTFGDRSLIKGITNAFFQTVTSRTAGFDAIPQANLTELSLMVTTVLMFIGACPGSTAGGIKLTTLMVILLLVINRFRGRTYVVAFKRSISTESIIRALTVFILSSFVVMLALGLLMFAEEQPVAHRVAHGWLGETLFEVISAFGTVGLSLGMTAKLSDFGKLILIVTMFAGRVGLLTLAFALARPPKPGELVYAEESVMTG
jgi:trk system potassium uptake protein TrkH